MKKKLVEILKRFGYPVYLQGTIAPGAPYPETFITFYVNDSEDGSHYDNKPANWVWDFDVFLYSSNPELVNSKPDEIRKALAAEGFIPRGKGWDIPSDEPSHTGWAQNYYYIEPNKEE